ncbi:MAG: hypothetical protein ACHQIO_20660, partial [Nevskiales bacterium]
MKPLPPRLSRPVLLLVALLGLTTTASAQDAASQPPAPAASASLPKQELTAKLLYQLLLAEIA